MPAGTMRQNRNPHAEYTQYGYSQNARPCRAGIGEFPKGL